MYHSIAEFEMAWKGMTGGTRKIMAALTDQSLNQAVKDGHRTLGRMAWHITVTIPEMMEQTGLKIDAIKKDSPLPKTAKEIQESYDIVARALLEQVKEKWTDEVLEKEDNLYGENWKRGLTLKILMDHEVHHRGQMTVLMRQAGLKVPGIYGPSYEEWETYNAPPPAI